MKKILIVILLFSLKASAQTDSTIVLNQGFQARIIEYMAPIVADPNNDANFSAFIKWRSAFRATQPTNTTVITVDTINVTTIVFLYNYILSGQEGFNISTMFKSQISAARTANSNLDRQCTAVETAFANGIIANRLSGRKYLLGK